MLSYCDRWWETYTVHRHEWWKLAAQCDTVVPKESKSYDKATFRPFLTGFRGNIPVSVWHPAHVFVLICFCDRCKSVEMLSGSQWLPSSLMGVTHRWPHNRRVIRKAVIADCQAGPAGHVHNGRRDFIVLWVDLDCTVWNDKTKKITETVRKNRHNINQQETFSVCWL